MQTIVILPQPPGQGEIARPIGQGEIATAWIQVFVEGTGIHEMILQKVAFPLGDDRFTDGGCTVLLGEIDRKRMPPVSLREWNGILVGVA